MEKHTMFMDLKAPHRKDVNYPKSDIQVYKILNKILIKCYRYRQDYSIIYVKSQRNKNNFKIMFKKKVKWKK